VASDVDLAWCAGLFDGEGTTSVLKAQRDKYAYIRMSISQKYPEVLEKFQGIVGVGSIYKSKTREIYSLDIYKQVDVLVCLEMLWPFLSEIKRKQATVAKDFVAVHSKQIVCGV
jgi:hypothetical protein